MDLNSALDIIIRDLREAREIIDDLKKVKGVSVIQVELAKAKCKSAEEIIELLKTIEQPPEAVPLETPARPPEAYTAPVAMASAKAASAPVTEHATEKQIPAAEASAPVTEHATEKQIPAAEASAPVTEHATEKQIPAPVASLPNTELDPQHEIPAPLRPEPLIELEAEHKEKKSVKGKSILADRYGEPADRVNERMRGTRGDNDISAKLKQSPISNLAEAIGVNDRFLYIREVFGGNREAYNNAIEKLNSVSSSGEAEKIINNYSPVEADPAAVKSLLELVRRKTGFNG